MKLIYITLLTFFSFLHQDSFRLSGKYKVEFDKKANTLHEEDYTITITDSTYLKNMKSGEQSRGVIQYGSGFGYLKEYEKVPCITGMEQQQRTVNNRVFIEFKKEGKDVIRFISKRADTAAVSLNSGKLIRI